jgi:glycine C-acetyltransferase
MSKKNLISLFKRELSRLDTLQVTKRHEKVISGFRKGKALIDNYPYLVFNSNDYLGFRIRPELLEAEHREAEKYGTGPGAVRFISGTLKIYQELEEALASFHQREAAMVVSSALY